MSESSPKNLWNPVGKATLAGLGLLVVITLVLVSFKGDPPERKTTRGQLERVREDVARLQDEGHALSEQLRALSESVGWVPESEQDKAGQPGDLMLARIIDGARLSFSGPVSAAWQELEALSDEALIAEVRSLRDRVEGLRRAGQKEPLPGLVQRLEVATSIMDNRGLEH